MNSQESLRILAGYAAPFRRGVPIGRWQGGEADAAGVIHMPWFERSAEVDRFVAERDVIPMDKAEKAEIFKSFTSGGMPKGSAGRQAGLSQAEIDDMLDEEDADRKKQQASLGQTLLEMQRQRGY